jgi:tRNA wybutosine-synthesizing protein 1
MPEAINYIKQNWKQVRSIFIVSAGLVPEMVEKLIEQNALPTQFYITFSAYNEELFKKVNRPLVKDPWKRFNKTLELLSEAKTRRVARITLIKGINDSNFEEWAKVIIKFKPHFVEIKGFSLLGYARKRLTKANVPTMAEVKEFSYKLLDALNEYGLFSYMDEHEPSRVVVLKNRERKYDIDPIIRSVEG